MGALHWWNWWNHLIVTLCTFPFLSFPLSCRRLQQKLTEFDTDAENGVPQPDLPSKFTQCKNPRWQWLPFWNQLNGHNSAIFERIRTKFDTEMERPKMRSHNLFYQQNWYHAKSKMAAAAILKITFLAICRPLLHIFAPNLIQRLKTGSCS